MPRRNNRSSAPVEAREHLLTLTASGFCYICWESIYPWQDISWDHVIPMSRGGPRGAKNKRLTHEVCNNVKGDRLDFFLRTEQQREALSQVVKPSTWQRLQRAWNGDDDGP